MKQPKTVREIFEETGTHMWFDEPLPENSIINDLPLGDEEMKAKLSKEELIYLDNLIYLCEEKIRKVNHTIQILKDIKEEGRI